MSFTRHALLPLALAAAFSCASVSANEPLRAPTPNATQQTYQITPEGALRRTLAHGIYQLLVSPAQQTLYVASAEYIPQVNGGVIYKLNPQTLETTGLIYTDEKNYGLAMDPAGETLFVTNSTAAAVTKIDLKTDKVLGRLVLTERSADGSPYGPRTVLYDTIDKVLYVGGVGDPGRIWVIDPESFTVKASIGHAGKWVTGLLRDADSPRVFAANGDGEVLVIDTQTHTITQRWKPVGDTPALLLNLALDRAGGRLFVTDHGQLKTVLVLDANTGTLRQRLPVGESLDVLYQPERNALYVTHRERGTLSVLDATTYAVRKRYTLPQHPNSLTLSPDGKQLFVSILTPFVPTPGVPGRWHVVGAGSVARIDLP